ncbi:MAG: TonB-dependent receptor, partial [Haliea sp.]
MFARKPVTLIVAACIGAGSANLVAQGLEEVVVTAQKREQTLQDAPISIAAFNADTLEQKGVSSIDDLGTSVPNVKITRSPSNTSAATIAIRGSATINPAITWEPTVGIYLDGVFIGKNVGGIFDIAELERVEMLRGPQGTLYGKNTVGGAVNLITTRPTGELGGKLRLGAGNHDLRTVYGTIDLPALELGGAGEIMAKLTASVRKRDGLYDNVNDPFGNPLANPVMIDEFNNLDNQVGRYDILWDMTDRFSLRYTWDYSDLDLAPSKNQLTFLDPNDFAGINALLAPYVTGDNENRDSVSLDQAKFERSKSISQSLFADYDAGTWGALGDVTLRYIGNTRKLSWDDDIDIDGSPVNLFTSARFIDYDQVSHELQMIGTTDRTNYVLGLYYFEEESDVFNPISFFGAFGAPTNNNRYGFDNDSFAVFGQVDWRPAAAVFQDRLTLTLGVRWTEETKDTYIDHPNDVDAMG